MNILKMDHIALVVRDIERTRTFYQQVLGMEVVLDANGRPGRWLRKGSAEIHLITEAEKGRAAQVNPGGHGRDEYATGRITHVAFEVDDLEGAQRHLQAHNIEIVGGPRPRGDGVQQLYICDPDGYTIELFVWEKR